MRGWQFLIIVLVVLLLFGSKKIPELMKGLGQGIQSFKQGMNEMRDEVNKDPQKDSEAGNKK